MKSKTICRRCHRLRAVNGARICASCDQELRAMERRRPVAPPIEDPPVERNGLVFMSCEQLSDEETPGVARDGENKGETIEQVEVLERSSVSEGGGAREADGNAPE